MLMQDERQNVSNISRPLVQFLNILFSIFGGLSSMLNPFTTAPTVILNMSSCYHLNRSRPRGGQKHLHAVVEFLCA